MAVDATSRGDPDDFWTERSLTVALETDVVPDAVARAIGWHDRLPFYTNELPLLWGRSLDNGAMLMGRELLPVSDLPADAWRQSIAEAGARLTARLRGLHPALAEIGVHRVWAGPIARDASGVPSVQRDPHTAGVVWAGGYGGHGLAQAFRLGARAAAAARP